MNESETYETPAEFVAAHEEQDDPLPWPDAPEWVEDTDEPV